MMSSNGNGSLAGGKPNRSRVPRIIAVTLIWGTISTSPCWATLKVNNGDPEDVEDRFTLHPPPYDHPTSPKLPSSTIPSTSSHFGSVMTETSEVGAIFRTELMGKVIIVAKARRFRPRTRTRTRRMIPWSK
ncbi:hypothetical protein K435DRAFT_125087 [Dendrothele bispora CBS 962.96]|uniref:Uncharacterized protein n=1 Tax=Dendrothele bispora (strain CBS 962.96) TaxID=1314807 RepID=A0A4S8M0K6_DENBC|nr:hypothetical protein K435DRAFT_125087 [Dendrothele bispora CBS 962.96]